VSFKLPCLTLKAIIPRITGLFSNNLEEIGVVGHGSFGVALKAKHCSPVNDEEAVVVKKLTDSDDNSYDQKEFVKEARKDYSIQHENVVRFKAFCQRPCATMLEYSCFDFSVFSDDCNKVVHREFLAFVDTLSRYSKA